MTIKMRGNMTSNSYQASKFALAEQAPAMQLHLDKSYFSLTQHICSLPYEPTVPYEYALCVLF